MKTIIKIKNNMMLQEIQIPTATTSSTIPTKTLSTTLNIPTNHPSLCIPRINGNITEKEIRSIIDDLKLGIIRRIDINKTKTSTNRCVFIHFNKWFDYGNAIIARERLLNGKDIKVIYDQPWFWKISAYRNK